MQSMATSNSQSTLSASLQSFRLEGIQDTGITVGDGSYATVLQYNFRGLKCVGKKIHRLLYEHASPAQRADMLRRFEEECELLGRLRHPNIVQFLGVHVETGSELPVLMMEYLPTNLSGYLDRHGVLPTETSYGILRDVALGLRYLHEYSPPIVHRDLSTNNVLLTDSLSAKISDLGVAKILNITPSQITLPMSTKAPGTPCYMPPEALVARPRYTKKIDSYSFGVMILHVMCGQWPLPTDPFQRDPSNPDIFVPVSEVDRRARFMQQMGSDHQLSGLVHQCLSNTSHRRPESEDILKEINTALSQIPTPVLQQPEVQTHHETAVNQPQTHELGRRQQPRPLLAQNKWHGQGLLSGNRDAILIISNQKAMAKNTDVISRCSVEITEEDKRMMIDQGLSPNECTDDISIVQARIRLDKQQDMVSILSSDGERELSRGYVLQQLENILQKTVKLGVVIYYIGHGKKNTGDWCFKDGFITFKDIAELYNRVFHCQLLTIVTDCSHSGAWVDDCVKYLDKQGVRPCGHSLKEKGLLSKVYASCRPEEEAATNCFFVRAVKNGKNDGTLSYYISKQLRESQQSYGLDTTEVRCGKSIEEACTLRPEYSWKRWSESMRIILHRCIVTGKQSWKYILLEDSSEKIRRFRQLTSAERSTVNVAEYGKTLKSGWGKDPPKEVKNEIDCTYYIF